MSDFLEGAHSDDLKVKSKSLEELSFYYQNRNPDSNLFYIQKLKDLASIHDDFYCEYQSEFRMGRYHFGMGANDSTAYYMERAANVAKRHKKELEKATAIKWQAISYAREDKLQEALLLFEKAKSVFVSLNDQKKIGRILVSIGNAKYSADDFEGAIEAFVEARSVGESIEDQEIVRKAFYNLGRIYESLGEFETSFEYCKKSTDHAEKTNDTYSLIYSLGRQGQLLLKMGRKKEALDVFDRIVPIARGYGNNKEYISSRVSLAWALLENGYCKESLKECQLALQVSAEDQMYKADQIWDRMAKAYVCLNQLKKAQNAANRSIVLADSLRGEPAFPNKADYTLVTIDSLNGDLRSAWQRQNKIDVAEEDDNEAALRAKLSEVESRYQNDKLKSENELLAKEKTWAEERGKRNQYLFIGMAILAALVLVIGVLIFKNSRVRSTALAQEKKALNTALELQKVEAEKAQEVERSKSRFFANISHEFRTPLTLILGPLARINQDKYPDLMPVVGVMERNGKRLLKLIDELLDLSKIESSDMKLKLETVRLDTVCKQAFEAFESLAAANKISLFFEAPNPVYAAVDLGKFEKIIFNLLSNAVKFNVEGGQVKLAIAAEGQRAKIFVQDTGIGLSKDAQTKVFDRFYRTEEAEHISGTGIGLALTKQLVELHQGEIIAESPALGGALFTVILPLAPAPQLKSIENKFAPEKANASPESQEEIWDVEDIVAKPTVLVVEDDKDLRQFIASILAENYEVATAPDGEEGLKMAQKLIPDLVVTDVMMPRMDGNELCKALKGNALTNHIPTIMLTARSSNANKIKGLEVGADDYLLKPFDERELLLKLSNLLKLRNAIQSKKGSLGSSALEVSKQTVSNDPFQNKLNSLIQENLDDSKFNVERASELLGVSRSQMHRKLKATVGISGSMYIRNFRLREAKRMMHKPNASAKEVSYACGFSSPSHFSKLFKECYGISPSEVKVEL